MGTGTVAVSKSMRRVVTHKMKLPHAQMADANRSTSYVRLMEMCCDHHSTEQGVVAQFFRDWEVYGLAEAVAYAKGYLKDGLYVERDDKGFAVELDANVERLIQGWCVAPCGPSMEYKGWRSPVRGHDNGLNVRVAGVGHDGVGQNRPLDHVMRHSPDGFEWGYAGSGPADLSLSILTHYFTHTGEPSDDSEDADPSEAAWSYHQRFKQHFVAKWGDEWKVASFEMTEWLLWADMHRSTTGT